MMKIVSLLLLCISLPIISVANINKFDEITSFIKTQEGFLELPKYDVTQYSIGYSTSVEYAKRHGYNGGRISKAKADYILQRRVLDVSLELKREFPEIGSYPESIQMALHSVYFNCPAIVGQNLKQLLNSRDYAAAAREIAWGHCPKGNQLGLINRRFREANLICEQMGYPLLQTPTTVGEFYKRKPWNLV
jgi:GH24 family phage-related lysozyme (muramidase)